MADHDESPREPPAVRRHDSLTGRCYVQQQQDGAPEDHFTSLPNDILFLSLLTIKQCVALSVLCTDFRRRLPSFIPLLDAFHVNVQCILLSSRYDISSFTKSPDSPLAPLLQNRIFPRALVRQCHIVFQNGVDLPKRLQRLLFNGLAETGVQDLVVESTGYGWLNLGSRDSGVFSIRSLRSLCLRRIRLWRRLPRRPSSSFACPLFTSLKIEFCFLRDRFLRRLLDSCPFLETLQLICCYSKDFSIDKLNIHSANLKHLVLLYKAAVVRAIDVRVPKLDSLVVKVVNKMHIEAPKAQTASFFLAFISQKDPSVALTNLFRAPFLRGFACLMLNSNKTPNGLAGIDEFIPPEYREEGMIFNLDFNLKDQSSTTILTRLLKKCNFCNTKFDIRVDSTRMQSSSTATARDDDNEHSIGLELINLQMMMPERRFERFLSNRKKMKKFKHTGLEMLRKRTSREQFLDTLASEESLFQVSSSIANCIEMKI